MTNIYANNVNFYGNGVKIIFNNPDVNNTSKCSYSYKMPVTNKYKREDDVDDEDEFLRNKMEFKQSIRKFTRGLISSIMSDVKDSFNY